MGEIRAEDLPLLERRRVEAGVLVPVIRAMQEAFGEEQVNAVVARTIRAVARTQGEELRRRKDIRTVAELAASFERGILREGSLIVEVVERDEARFGFDVTRCKFVEMYESMGARDLGYLLSCNRDFAMFEGMAPNLEFDRTQTRMEGASHCDFRYRAPAAPRPA